jgi:L-seryl-tRNA(Ser) seleniumtransferase
MSDPRRSVPRTDAVLADAGLRATAQRLGRPRVKREVVAVLQEVRDGALEPTAVVATVAQRLAAANPGALRPILNATGVVLHTNLGRAPLGDAAVDALGAAAGYVDLEFDLEAGQRAARGRDLVAALRRAVPAAEGAFAVNNGAAALVLAATSLASGQEILVSRGEMVEIGDGFRLPDLIESCGARLREVGTTNRVTLADYRDAIGPATAGILKVHPSNFRIDGFTHAVLVDELATLPLPVIADVGSGLLMPHPLLPDEPDVTAALRAGAAVVTCSADKLLGGPQAGLVFGHADVLARMRRHPLARAVRVDKLTIAALTASLDSATPTWLALTADPETLRIRCVALAEAVGGKVTPSDGVVGGGGAPGVRLPGWAVAVPAELAVRLRIGIPSVVGRVAEGRCLLDLRCVPESADATLRAAVLAAAAAD